MIRRLQPFRHVFPVVALVLCAAAWAFPPFFDPNHAGQGAAFVEPLAISSALVGWLLTIRRPENPIGWLFSIWSVGVGFNAFAGQYVNSARLHPGLPAAPWVAWIGTVLWHPGFGLFVLILLLFPTGTVVTHWWRRFTWFAVGLYSVLGASVVLYPQAVLPDWYPHLQPPFHTPGVSVGDVVYGVTLTANLFCIFIALGALVVRYRQSAGAQRYQIKWFVWPVVGMLLLVLASFFIFGDGRLFPILLPVIPLSAGVAILRYRLYDIDRVISRSVAWLLLTGLVVGVYIGVVATTTAVLPGSSSLGVAAATLAAAAVFEPARRRLQTMVDRRFNRERYNASRLVEDFAGTLRASVDLQNLEGQLVDVTSRTMHPATIALWVVSANSSSG